MGTYTILFIATMIFLSFLYHIEPSNRKTDFERRKTQTRDMFRQNIIKEKLDKIVDDKVTKESVRKTEAKIIQAGFNFNYTEFLMLQILVSVVMGLTFGILMTNPLLGILFVIIGFLVPPQALGFIRNRRMVILEDQIGSFMHMAIKRYENTRDFNSALRMTAEEFQGEEPIYTELNKSVTELNLGMSTEDVLNNLAIRTGNKYMERFSAYYEVASRTGVPETRRSLMMQAYLQYEENRNNKRMLSKEISGPVQEAYIMLAFVPLVAVYQIFTNPDYVTFMTKTLMGRVGTTAIIGTMVLIVWFINAKLAAPLD